MDVNEFENHFEVQARPIYESLARQGIRVFCISIKPHDQPWHWIHIDKTVNAWRHDIREFLEFSDCKDDGGWAQDDVHNALGSHLRSLGYVEVDDIVADVFEGRITNECARLIDAPVHEEQRDGFGHFGWENGRRRNS